ncbi:hypothetical protein [Streptomyces sp. NPDC093984]|uniref:hypothetical protein n=1 Tax=Streptomyces sp. NPDC093984 TaxID=3366052 RepID=UPI00382740AE
MQETGSRPTWPVILIDDDQWLTVCESDRDIQLAVEPDFVDNIVVAYDGLARQLELLEVGNQVTLRVSGPPQPEQLHRRVQEYRTVEGEIDPAMDRAITSRASSGHDQRDRLGG